MSERREEERREIESIMKIEDRSDKPVNNHITELQL